jgi:RNA polymerase sigma factor (sigma-70 family)
VQSNQRKIPPISDKVTRRFLDHDRATLKEIYTKNYPSVEAYIIQNSGSSDDAKDIFQEAITAAWLNTKEGKFTPQDESSLGGYIYRIAKYKWLDRVKSKSYKSTMRLAEDYDPAEEVEMDGNDEKLNQLRTIYAQLGDRCKNILNRFYYSKMSLDEIGSELGFDPATVKTQKYRCMKKLRDLNSENNG